MTGGAAFLLALALARPASSELSFGQQVAEGLEALRQARAGLSAGQAAARALDEHTADVVERSLPSVATIVVKGPAKRFSLLAAVLRRGEKAYVPAGMGTGWVARADGLLVTNAHVVEDTPIGGRVIVQFPDHVDREATVVARNRRKDLALVRLTAPPAGLAALPLGDSTTIRRGQRVIALGSPLELRQSATLGVISAEGIQRDLFPGRYLQTDTAINPGNSGGPLLDAQGRVVGVNFALLQSIGQSPGFVIPVEYVKLALRQYEMTQRLSNAYLGVRLEADSWLGQMLPGQKPAYAEGAWIKEVAWDSPAAGELKPGDRIESIDGRNLPRPAYDACGEVERVVSEKSPGETLRLVVFRDGKPRAVEITLAEAADD
ncbi:MAG: trypsin-like peptidase domain-containing protein [Elusimicrobia bacterium]|nr:trypsin-like peptidase domain-containing protein [Elusimicrobiota bacterium]